MPSFQRIFWSLLFPLGLIFASTQGACVCVTPTFLPNACTIDSDCGTGFNCINGQCQVHTPTCSSASDCTPPLTCINSRCVVSTTCVEGEQINCRIGSGSGPCADGTRTCRSGQFLTCEPKPGNQAKPESCNGQDDDCDGLVDESFPEQFQVCTVPSAQGPCSEGLYTCQSGTLLCRSTYQPLPEQVGANNCGDGIDNDCDGKIDNDDDGCKLCNPGQTQLCYTGPTLTQGVGPCKSGTQTCRSEGGFGPCTGQVLPQAEVCGNGVDDDCDGKTDENCDDPCNDGDTRSCFSGPDSAKNVGRCKEGQQTCLGKIWGPCQGEILPKKEPCEEGQDNDCDGKPDTCLPPACKPSETRPCYSGPLGCKPQADGSFACQGLCKAGLQTCSASSVWGSCQGEIQPSAEVCSNQKDDDCDGKTDEGCTPVNREEIATSSWETFLPIKLWDSKQKTTIRTFSGGHADIVYVVRFSPDGSLLATAGQDGKVILWNPTTGQQLWAKADHAASVHALAFDAKGRWLASASSNGTLFLWDLKTGALLHRLTGHQGGIYALAASSDGLWLASGGSDTAIRLWDTSPATPVLKTSLQGHSQDIYALAFSPTGGRLASGGRDTSLLLWNLTTLTLAATLRSHSQGITSLAFRPDGTRLASGSSDQTIKIWDPLSASSSPLQTLQTPNNDPVYTLSFHSLGDLLASGTYNGKLLLWNLSTGAIDTDIQAHTSTVSSVSFRP